jgi:hypothetical protein
VLSEAGRRASVSLTRAASQEPIPMTDNSMAPLALIPKSDDGDF